MAELLGIIAMTALFGYLNSKDDGLSSSSKDMPKELQSNGPSIYTSNRANEVRDEMQLLADNIAEQSKTPQFTGVIPPLFNTYGTRGGGIEFEERVNAQSMGEIREYNKVANVLNAYNDFQVPTFDTKGLPTGIANFNEMDKERSLLTGLPLDKKHSNMVPFFGSVIKQRTDESSNAPLIERYTGTEPRTGKKEIQSLYDKTPQNIWGNPAFTTQIDVQSRYIPSAFRENELPFRQERISAPIAWGPEDTIKPTFKTIDELVVNAKETYDGRLIETSKLAGEKGTFRGIVGKLEKNRPETSFQLGEDRYFKGPGAVVAPKIDPDSSVIMREQKITPTSYYGGAMADIKNETVRIGRGDKEEFQTLAGDVKRKVLEDDDNHFVRNAQTSSQLRSQPTDGIMVQNTERGEENTQILGPHRQGSAPIQELFDNARLTIKETTVFDVSKEVTPTAPIKREPMGQLDDVRTTSKEQLVESKYNPQKYRGVGELSRKQYDTVQLRKELENDERMAGPQYFNMSASKNLVHLLVKDKINENTRENAPDFVNKQSAHRMELGEFSSTKREENIFSRTFGVAGGIAEQLRTNDFKN